MSWRIEVTSLGGAGFGASVFLNGEEVYSEPGTEQPSHEIGVTRSRVPGENLVEVEITASTESAADYVASCTAEVAPTMRVVHADGVPRTLEVGERLFLRLSL